MSPNLEIVLMNAAICAQNMGVEGTSLAEMAQERVGELIAQVIPRQQSPAAATVTPIEAVAPTLRQRAAKRKVGG